MHIVFQSACTLVFPPPTYKVVCKFRGLHTCTVAVILFFALKIQVSSAEASMLLIWLL